MSQLLGSELTEELLHRLKGDSLSSKKDKAIVIVTVDESGWAHPGMLSYSEVVAKDRSTIDLAVAAVLGLGYWGLRDGARENPYVTAPVQKGEITQVVTATGTLQAVVTVQVGSQVSGTIAKLNADFNSKVKQGQVVAELDPDK